MANARGKKIDKTFLSVDNATERGFLHRDYIAHCLRWTHVVKWLMQGHNYKTAKVLDVGCGKEMPLAKMLHSSRMGTAAYVGADISKLEMPKQFANSTWKPTKVLGEVDAAELTVKEIGFKPTNIVCFEVLEHIEPEHARRMLLNFAKIIDQAGTVFLSTPCYDEHTGAAANHVNEMTYQAFGKLIEDTGWFIEGHWGTFASIKDYKDGFDTKQLAVFKTLREYYDSNYLATVFAPMFPQFSRNCLWQLAKRAPSSKTTFPDWKDIPTPWSSSEEWKQLDGSK